jgi:hypothetical protein
MRTSISVIPIVLHLAASAIAQGTGSPAFSRSGVEGDEASLASQAPASTGRSPLMIASAATAMPGPASTPRPAPSSPASRMSVPSLAARTPSQRRGVVGDYDFGEVVQALRDSVQPLAGEMDTGFPRFVGQIDDAIALMDQGRSQEAVALSSQAVDGILSSRDQIVNPLWEAQFYLNQQIAVVRSRLAESLSANDPTTKSGKASAQSTQMLDQIATRIAQTNDPVRKKRLVAHYRTMRTLTKVRANTLSMTPDQRKLWFGVLKVLEQASIAHQQVLMGSESLFAQLDGTGSQLRDYLGLMQTMEGVDALLGSVQGDGMASFVEGMRTLQEQMETFSESMQGALEASMVDLESRVDALQSSASGGNGEGVMTPTEIDEELQSRINRVAPAGAAKE